MRSLVLAALFAGSVVAHGMHGIHVMQMDMDMSMDMDMDMGSTSPSDEYRCPACGMNTMSSGYDNENYVQMDHGQRIYTCGMAPRSFADYDHKSTDTSYVAANMAEFIVNKGSEEYDCEDGCGKCSEGIKCPVSGEPISEDKYSSICLKKGQKIYFGSDKSRDKYLSNVVKEPRYLVDEVICEGSPCKDAEEITKLSTQASEFQFEPETSESTTEDNSKEDTSAATTTESTDSDFCSGAGSVMFNGFQSTINGSCVMLFFQSWVLDSQLKYVFGFIGCFLIALFNEYLVRMREQVRQKVLEARRKRRSNKAFKYQSKALLALLYMIQMTVAYFAMLVVMIYESGLFIALILGFGAGFVLFKSLDKDVSKERGAWRFHDPSTVRLHVEGMMCMANCGTTVENALKSTPGVTRAYVDFEDGCAYAAGQATPESLVQAVEDAGFKAELDADLPTPNV